MPRRDATLIESKPLSPSVIGLTFRATDGLPWSFVPGQWVDVHLLVDGAPHKRAYSIASAPGSPKPDCLEFAVTRVDGGAMSNALFALTLGARVEVDGPHGFFVRERAASSRPALFIATGTGLAPLRSMLQVETQQPDGPPLVLLFGCRTRDDILWRDELDAWIGRCSRLRVEVTLSRADHAWTGRRGYVQAHLADVLNGLDHPHVYICGLSRMVQDVRRSLKDSHGFDRTQIQSERYD